MMAHHDPSPLASPLDAAQVLTARGWTVFPCDHPDAGLHCTGTATRCREGRCGADDDPTRRGKHPRVPWGRVHAPADAARLREWFGEGLANVAVACGPSGLLVVDEDTEGAFAAFCASIGETVPDTFRVHTARGWHWYFTVPTDPATGERPGLGNAPGALAGWHCDVRGGASASAPHGGYVIGPGSTHASGIVYVAPDPYGEVLTAPGWLLAAVSAGPSAPAEGTPARTGSRDGHGTAGGTRWDDDPRYGTAADLRAQFARHCSEVVDRGGPFRHELFLAALDGWRLVALELLDEREMLTEVAHCVHRVWRAAPDDRDQVIVFDEARPAARRSPWQLTSVELRARALASRDRMEIDTGHAFARPSEALTSDDGKINRTTDGNVAPENVTLGDVPRVATVDTAEITGDPEVDLEIHKLRVRRRAVEALAREGRRPLQRLSLADFRKGTGPEYLVPRMLYRNGLAVIFGKPGTAKSFLALDVCLAFAAGRPWCLDENVLLRRADGGPGKAHYVMAEGRDANLLRLNAWQRYHGVADDTLGDRVGVFDQAIELHDSGVAEYLPFVVEDRPDLIVLDTRNAMFVGQESSGDDYGAMIRLLHRIREAAGGCAVVLIDHSGLKDDTRTRGSNALLAAVDTAVLVTDDADLGVYTAQVGRDKNASKPYPRWHFRLQTVDEVTRSAYVDAPAVVVPATPGEHQPFALDGTWNLDDSPLPDVTVSVLTGRGRKFALLVVRIMRWVGGAYPVTQTDLKDAIIAAKIAYDRTQMNRALALLEEKGVIEHPAGTTARWMLTGPHAGPPEGLGTVLG